MAAFFPKTRQPTVCGHCRFAHKTTSAATVHNQVFLHLHLDQIWTKNQPTIHKINEYIYSVIRNDSFKMPDYGTEKSLFCRVKIIVGFYNKLIKRI